MALIRDFQIKGSKPYRPQGKVEAHCYLSEEGGRRLLQINTFGSSNRKVLGARSQTIQLDDASASELFSILKNQFGFR